MFNDQAHPTFAIFLDLDHFLRRPLYDHFTVSSNDQFGTPFSVPIRFPVFFFDLAFIFQGLSLGF